MHHSQSPELVFEGQYSTSEGLGAESAILPLE